VDGQQWRQLSQQSADRIPRRLDGRTIAGSIDDYWVAYLTGQPDPYITGGWTEHAWEDAIGIT